MVDFCICLHTSFKVSRVACNFTRGMLRKIKNIMAPQKTAPKKKNSSSATVTRKSKRNDQQISVDNNIRTDSDEVDGFIPIRV